MVHILTEISRDMEDLWKPRGKTAATTSTALHQIMSKTSDIFNVFMISGVRELDNPRPQALNLKP